MGDKACIKFIDRSGGAIYLNSQWSGRKLPYFIKEGIEAGRVHMDADSIRYIIHLVGGDMDAPSHYGVSTTVPDGGDHDAFIVDYRDQTVIRCDFLDICERCDGEDNEITIIKKWSFEGFVQQEFVEVEDVIHCPGDKIKVLPSDAPEYAASDED